MDVLNPYPNKRRIHFKDDGTFRLTVFSDLHFGENPWDDWGPEQDRKSLIVMNNMLDLEQPDFVAINGDLITGDSKAPTLSWSGGRLKGSVPPPRQIPSRRTARFSSTNLQLR